MNPDSPSPQEEMEIQITAMLLGELSEVEAEALREKIARDSELSRLHEQLKDTIALMKETASWTARKDQPQLSPDRREKLLQSFKLVRPLELNQPKNRKKDLRVWGTLAAMIAVLLCAFAMIQGFWSERFMAIDQLGKAERQAVTSVELDLPTGGSERHGDFETSTIGRANRPAQTSHAEIVLPQSSEGLLDNFAVRDPSTINAPPPAMDKAAESPKSIDRFGGIAGAGGGYGGGGYGEYGPPPAVVIPEIKKSETISKPLWDARDLSERGRLGEVESKLKESFQKNSGLALQEPVKLQEDRFAEEARKREAAKSEKLVDVERGWSQTGKQLAQATKTEPGPEADLSLSKVPPLRGMLDRQGQVQQSVDSLGLLAPPENSSGFLDPSISPKPQSDFTFSYGLGMNSDIPGKKSDLNGLVPVPQFFAQNLESAQIPPQESQTDEGAKPASVEDFWHVVPSTRGLYLGESQKSRSEGQTTLGGIASAAGSVESRQGSFGKDLYFKQLEDAPTNLARRSGDLPEVNPILPPSSVTSSAPASSEAGLTPDAAKIQSLIGREKNWMFVNPSKEEAKTSDSPREPGKSAAKQARVVQNRTSISDEVSRYDVPDLSTAKDPQQPPSGPTVYTMNADGKAMVGGAIVETAVPEELAKEASRFDLERRQLADLQRVRDTIYSRILQETVDAHIPKTTLVQIVDPAKAESSKTPTVFERLRGVLGNSRVERTARIEVSKGTGDISPMLQTQNIQSPYDPYFMETEFEKIKSQTVLDKVIEKLNLNEAWAEKHGGGKPLKTDETRAVLEKMINLSQSRNTGLVDIKVKSDKPDEAALIANTIAEVYQATRIEKRGEIAAKGIAALQKNFDETTAQIAKLEKQLVEKEAPPVESDKNPPRSTTPPLIPQPEIQTTENAFSTFSLNVSDVSFKLAAASLEQGVMPDPGTVRSEEFINAFDYHDPEPQGSARIAFAWERGRYPFAHDRDLLRFSIKTAASGRSPGRPLNLVLLLDNSGSMERADRVRIVRECLRVLASQLQAQDRVSVVAFARTARLWVDGLPGSQAGDLQERVGALTPQGGTNLEEAMNLAYQTALKHYLTNGVNRVVLLTDGAANLGEVEPESLKKKVEDYRRQGVALDCFGIGWEGYNDDLLEVLSRNGDGRYGFVNTPEAASSEFAGQLAGALQVAASDVKVQVEFNPRRITAYRQIGYARHQLTKEQFRDNTVDAAEIGAAEAGNALYVVQVNPVGEGPLATIRVRFKIPGTADYQEHEWTVPYERSVKSLEQSSTAMRLAATAAAFSEWLASNPYAAEVTPDRLLGYMAGIPESCPADPRPKQLESMIQQARRLTGK